MEEKFISSDDVTNILTLAAEAAAVNPEPVMQVISMPTLEAQNMVNMGNLEPIVMTLENMSTAQPILTKMTSAIQLTMPGDTGNHVVARKKPDHPAMATQTTSTSDMIRQSGHMTARSLLAGSHAAKYMAKATRDLQPREVYKDSDTGVTYEIVRGGTKRGGDRLIDSLGFNYNLKSGKGNKGKNVAHWWCAVRNAHLRCPASVIQKGNTFMRSKRKHEHLVGKVTPKPNYDMPKRSFIGSPRGRPGKYKTAGMSSNMSHSRDYSVIKEGSKAGMDLLRDRLGYTYTMKRSQFDGWKMVWRCSVRNKNVTCRASIIVTGDDYVRTIEHSHMPGRNTPLYDNGTKIYWTCSVRNKNVRCSKSVTQFNDCYYPGKTMHCHMPYANHPLLPHEKVPTLDTQTSDMNGDGEDSEGDLGEEDDDTNEHSYGTETSVGSSVYTMGQFRSPGNSNSKGFAQRQRMLMKEKKRKEHQTFLGPSCTINLTKCCDPNCNCKLVHCPFCDTNHFKPAKAGRVQDHLEMTHFAHGVQYDDLMIVKCFHDCNLDRSFGHYHCVFCFKQILKRTAYARHMLRHLRNMGVPDRLLVLPDSKYPDVINAYGYEIPICKKQSCETSHDKHYHCPQCETVCQERSLTVNHLWRCLQRSSDQKDETDQLSDDADEDMINTVDESQLNLHFTHLRSFKDVPQEKCAIENCCGEKYHCFFCPPAIFPPTYKQHLIAHYVSHWNQRVQYKGFGILKCFLGCEGIDRSMCKTRYHLHCPICCKIILTKNSFEDHLDGCHMFKFGENLMRQDVFDHDVSMEEEEAIITAVEDNGHIEMMEEIVTSTSLKRAKEKFKVKQEERAATRRWGRPTPRPASPPVDRDSFVRSTIKAIKQEMPVDDDIDDDYEEMIESPVKTKRGNSASSKKKPVYKKPVDIEVFELGSVVVAQRAVRVFSSQSGAKSTLRSITKQTSTRLIQMTDNQRFVISGKLENLTAAQKLLKKAVKDQQNKADKEDDWKDVSDDDSEDDDDKHEGSGDKKQKSLPKRRGRPPKTPAKEEEEVPTPDTGRKGRGRPKKTSDADNGDSFPYSEIKEIIAATKDSVKKGRGRPPKVSESKEEEKVETPKPGKKKVTKGKVEEAKVETPVVTPGRYGTRGIKRNYADLSEGKVEIKIEPVEPSDDEVANTSTGNRKSTRKSTSKLQNQKSKGKESPRGGPAAKRKKVSIDGTELEDAVEAENDDDDDDDVTALDKLDKEFEFEFLDASDQEVEEDMDDSSQELDEYVDNDDMDQTVDDEMDIPALGEGGKASNHKITDSAVKNLRKSNVKTNVPLIKKVGIRNVKIPMKKKVDDSDDESEQTEEMKLEKLKCSLCNDHTAASFSDLTNHLKVEHKMVDIPRCDICEKDFDQVQALEHHLARKHGPSLKAAQFECLFDGCGRVFISQNGLTGHINRVHLGSSEMKPEKKHRCQHEQCQFTCNSIELFWEHKRKEHGEKINCENCSVEFPTYGALKAHNRNKHSDKSLLCNFCHKKFSNENALSKHKNLHISAGFKCTICNKTVTSRHSLMAHMDTHKPVSERTFRHICDYCGKGFTLRSNYEDHLNKHTGARPYKCDICFRTFGFRSMLQKHNIFVHSTDRPFKCGYCMKGFKFMNLLQNHLTTHTNKSNHVCTTCNKKFTTASTLKFHQQKCKGQNWNNSQQGTGILYSDLLAQGLNPALSAQGMNPVTSQQPGYFEIKDNVIVEEPKTIAVSGAGEQMVQYTTIEDGAGLYGTEVPTTQAPAQTSQAEQQVSEVEVYACSECNTTFSEFADAERHVLTAHPATTSTGSETETVEIAGQELVVGNH